MFNQSILAVSAHPDNVEFSTGGSLARWISEGRKVFQIVCIDGGKGTHDPAIKPSERAVLRREEQLAAARSLNISKVFFLDYPDGELNKSPNLVSILTSYIRLQPERLVSWDPWHRYKLHLDHCAPGKAAIDAVMAAGNPHCFPALLDEKLHPHAFPEVYLFGTDQPDTWVDITNTIEHKLYAIACHQSQMDRISTHMNDIRSCNAEYGKHGSFTYAEAFKVLHPFCDT
jgi:LmbE family N-acetylglucosaminyl deacetylase